MAILGETSRLLGRHPFRLVAVVVSMATGVAAAVAALSVAHVAMVKPLPFSNAEELYHIGLFRSADPNAHPSGGIQESEAAELIGQLLDIAEVAAFRTGWVLLGDGQQSARLPATFATDSLLDVLRVSPETGYLPSQLRSVAPHSRSIVVSQAFSQSRLGWGESAAADLFLDREPVQLSGTLPKWFTFPESQSIIVSTRLRLAGDDTGFSVVLRLPRADLLMELRRRIASWQEIRAQQAPERWDGLSIGVEPLAQMFVNRADRQAISVMVLASLVALGVALFSSAAGLCAHFIAGIREIAIKLALGATRKRIAVQGALLGATIGLISAILAVPLSIRGLRWVNDRILARGDLSPPAWLQFELAPTGVVLAIGSSVFMALSIGLVLGWRMSSLNIASVLSDSTRSHPSGWFVRMLRILLVAQGVVATSLTVIAGGLQLGLNRAVWERTFFDGSRILISSIELDRIGYPDGQHQSRFVGSLATSLDSLIGSSRVALSSILPNLAAEMAEYELASMKDEVGPFRVQFGAVSQNYFEIYGAKLLAGRLFDDTESYDSMPVAIVNEHFAKRHGNRDSIIGAQVKLWPRDVHSPVVTVIGVVASPPLLPKGVEGHQEPVLLRPLIQDPNRRFFVSVGTVTDSRATLELTLRQAVEELDPLMPLHSLRNLAELRAERLAGLRIFADITAAIGLLASILSFVGVYVIFSYRAATRARDIAICQSLGASPIRAIWIIVRGDLVLLFVAIAGGATGGLFALQLIRGIFWEMPLSIQPMDVVVPLLVVVLAGLLAVSSPARIATDRNVFQAIRQE